MSRADAGEKDRTHDTKPEKPPCCKPDPNDEERRRLEIAIRRLAESKGRTYTPWLLIRYNATDMGMRPLPSGTPFWASPDISVESSDVLGRPVAGEPNFLHARVFNLGKAPSSPTRVQFYWGDPSLGLGGATMNLIGTEWVEIPAHASRDVRCNTPWVPVMVNGGHECVMVNTHNPLLDPIVQPFRAWLDRHVGQRNLTVIPSAAGQVVMFSLTAANILPMMARTQFVARIEHLRIDRAAVEKVSPAQLMNEIAAFGAPLTNTAQELRGRFAPGTAEARMAAMLATRLEKARRRPFRGIRAVGRQTRSAAGIYSKLGEPQRRVLSGESFGSAGQLFTAADTLSREARAPQEGRDLLLHTLDFEPNELRTLELEFRVPGNAAPGEFVVFHIVQRVDTIPIGGYTVIVMIEK